MSDSNPKQQSTLDYLRSFRICEIALFDLILAFVGMIYLSYLLHFDTTLAIALTIPLGIAVHWMFGIPTTLNRKLGIAG